MKQRQRFEPWRQFLFSTLLLLAMGMAVTACSSEETEDFTIQFRLEDENGNPKNEFRQGENIIFRLTIYNNTDAHYSINDWGSLFGEDLFRVYSSNGSDLGKSWEINYYILDIMEYIFAHDSRTFICPWMTDENLSPTYPLVMKEEAIQHLPIGDYYTEFNLRLNENNVIHCKQNFKIR